jgi:hypothetical protein
MNAVTAGHAGTPQLKQFLMVNIKMFRHPKYYKELRKRNKLAESRQPVVGGQQQSDQVISLCTATAASGRAPGPGLKLQAPGVKLSNQPVQASSDKRQAPGSKLQASSHKLQAQ